MACNMGKLVFVLAAVYIMDISALPLKMTAKRSTAETEVKVVRAGHRVELDCKARANSPIVFHWRHNGLPISQGPLDHLSENVLAPSLPESAAGIMVHARGQLVIQQVKEHHGGKYTCVADTGDERTAKSYTIEVIPTKEVIEPVEEELRFYQMTYNIGQQAGLAAYFTCRATQGVDKPAPLIKWSLGDTMLENDVANGVVIHGNGDLELSHITVDYHVMQNTLRCIAYGQDGAVIESKPEDIGVYVFGTER